MTGKWSLTVRFGPFALDHRARTLHRGTAAIHLSPKAFDLLTLLLQHRPAAIAKSEIHQRLWPDTFVSDGNLAVLVAEIRQALGDSAREATFIRTVQRFGYAFSGLVDETGAALRRKPAACWIVWSARRTALEVGSNILGRDPAVDINIDAVGVSRRHAMIVVADNEITLVDLASKNGTFANGVRVTGSVRLTGDTEIHLGPVAVRLSTLPDDASTQTWSSGSR